MRVRLFLLSPFLEVKEMVALCLVSLQMYQELRHSSIVLRDMPDELVKQAILVDYWQVRNWDELFEVDDVPVKFQARVHTLWQSVDRPRYPPDFRGFVHLLSLSTASSCLDFRLFPPSTSLESLRWCPLPGTRVTFFCRAPKLERVRTLTIGPDDDHWFGNDAPDPVPSTDFSGVFPALLNALPALSNLVIRGVFLEDLDSVAQSCPHLESLELDRVETLLGQFYGTFWPNLTRLSITSHEDTFEESHVPELVLCSSLVKASLLGVKDPDLQSCRTTLRVLDLMDVGPVPSWVLECAHLVQLEVEASCLPSGFKISGFAALEILGIAGLVGFLDLSNPSLLELRLLDVKGTPRLHGTCPLLQHIEIEDSPSLIAVRFDQLFAPLLNLSAWFVDTDPMITI